METIEEFTDAQAVVEKKQQPIDSGYIPLGEGKGLRFAVWPNYVQIERQERDTDGKWKKTQELAIAKKILPELMVRIPKWFERMKTDK